MQEYQAGDNLESTVTCCIQFCMRQFIEQVCGKSTLITIRACVPRSVVRENGDQTVEQPQTRRSWHHEQVPDMGFGCTSPATEADAACRFLARVGHRDLAGYQYAKGYGWPEL